MPIIFPVTTPVSTGRTTLALIEQTTAQRCGPYRPAIVTSTIGSSQIQFDSLKSGIEYGGIRDLYVLRRFATNADDRQRSVKDFAPLTGIVEVDRGYADPPSSGEQLEFHHLEPMLELRASVLAGLARCFFMDRVTITLNGAAASRDLTTAAYWITNPRQVYRAQMMAFNVLTQPRDIPWTGVFEQDGHIWLGAAPDPLPYGLLVHARRAHSTWVNGENSTTGPLYDDDTLSLDLAYAVAAAHVEAWRIARPRLQAAADQKLTTSQGEAAVEFTTQARSFFRPPKRRVMLSAPYGYDNGRRPLSLTSG
jgi:hypothetical protein